MQPNPTRPKRSWRHALSPLLLAVALVATACSGPLGVVPGRALAGDEVAFPGGTFPTDLLPADRGVIQLETRPEAPYSVNVGVRRIGDHLYLDPAGGRVWFQHIQVDDRVRVRLPASPLVHPARAIEVTEDTVLEQFASDRIVLRLVPRTPEARTR